MKLYVLLLFLSSVLGFHNNPIELGKVDWNRNYNDAIQLAQELDKPIFLLFQEVPGCATCRNYGAGVLSHPLIVEAIEDEFVPLAIFNNKKGHDADILKQFKEPSWNNPVARIINSNGKDISHRVSGNYSQLGVVDAMINALTKSGRAVPVYLQLFREELIGKEHAEDMALSMYCFWSGERELASIKGVIATEAGFMDGHEVVKIRYNAKDISAKKIAQKASGVNCADGAYIPKGADSFSFKNGRAKHFSAYRKDKQNKYYLFNSVYKSVPMLRIQELKVNRALAIGDNPEAYLSPRQLDLLASTMPQKKSKLKNRIAGDFVSSWYDLFED